MTRQLASEGAKHHIRANTISPALIVTSHTKQRLDHEPGFKEMVLSCLMLDRLGTPDEHRLLSHVPSLGRVELGHRDRHQGRRRGYRLLAAAANGKGASSTTICSSTRCSPWSGTTWPTTWRITTRRSACLSTQRGKSLERLRCRVSHGVGDPAQPGAEGKRHLGYWPHCSSVRGRIRRRGPGSQRMRVTIEDDCIRCALCEDLIPDVFQFDSRADAIVVKRDPIPSGREKAVAQMAADCPMQAIEVL